jgi:signal transduction histidine kinase
MTVALSSDGAGHGLTPLVDRAVHRVVQESLTNAARHAPGAGVVVTLRHTSAEVLVSVHDDGSPAPPATAPGGSGLAGLRERVRLLGGTLRAEPRGGGFAVTARIPRMPDSAGEAGR